MTNDEITQALKIIAPNAQWSLLGDNYDDIQWDSSEKKPSLEEVTQIISQLPKLAAEKKAEDDAAKAASEAKKQEVLTKLGLTADEVAALLA